MAFSSQPLTEAQEAQWQEISRHIAWSSRFCLIVLFVEDARVAEQFKQRLQQQLQTETHTLYELQPTDATTLTQAIFDKLRDTAIPQAAGACWLALHLQDSEQWQWAVNNFLARLNERRDVVRRQFPRPFVLLLPSMYKARVREIAPDLWSVRNYSNEIRAEASPPILPQRDALPAISPSPPGRNPLDLPAIKEWHRVKDLVIAPRELCLVVDNAFAAAFEHGFWDLAQTLAEQMVALCRQRLEREDDWVWDDLAVALERLGDIEAVFGHYALAHHAYAEALQIHRDLIQQQGEEPGLLRNLSVALIRVADTENALGRYQAALDGYRESLQIFRQLRQTLGDTPQVLRDLSVSLDNVANTENALGRYQAALDGYRESLQIRHQLRQTLGDTPQVLRDLSVALNKVADTENALGRYQAALDGYRESLHLCRELRQTLGDTPQVLRDLSVSLEKVANTENALGRYQAALDGYRESLQICRELRQTLGDTPQVLDDLSWVLQRLGDCEAQLQHDEIALAYYRESLPLLARLKATMEFDDGYSQRIDKVTAAIAALEQ